MDRLALIIAFFTFRRAIPCQGNGMRVASYCSTFLKPEMLHVYRQITGLRRWETFVVTRERREEARFPMPEGAVEVQPRVRSNFVRRFWLKYVRREPPIVYRGEYGTLANILQRRQADLLHVYFGHTGVHLLPFIRRWPLPTVVSFHGMDVQTRAEDPGYLDKLRELLQVTPLVLARSVSLQQRLLELGCDPAKLRLNRTGIPLQAFPEVERKEPLDGGWRWVQACRLIEKKGLDDTLHAFAGFRRVYPKASLVVAGEGPLRAELESLCAQLKLGNAVQFAGFLSGAELAQLYQRSHFFVHPSRITADQNQEGVPNSMLEAMATGLPVLATRHGGIPEAVEHERTGLLVAERDWQGLLEHALQLSRAPEAWRQMGREAAAAMRENFEASAQIAKLESFYDEAVQLHQLSCSSQRIHIGASSPIPS